MNRIFNDPAFPGDVGDNMVDAVAIGEIFSSPTAQAFAYSRN